MVPTSTPGLKSRGPYTFGPFQLDAEANSLCRNGEPVPLTPKVFDTLLALVSNSGRTLTKDELVQTVWPDAAVGDGSLAQNILVLRKILDPYFEGEGPIATVPRRGYRFTAPVTSLGQSVATPVASPPPTIVDAGHQPKGRRAYARYAVYALLAVSAAGSAFYFSRTPERPVPKRRSVAVLALKNLTAKPEVDWYSTALAETITGELRAGGDLRIIASDTVGRMQQELSLPGVIISRSQIKDIRNDLGCDLVLSGSYLTLGDKIRVELLLSDARTSDAIASINDTDDQTHLLELVSRAGQQLRSKIGARPLQDAQSQMLRHSMSADTRANRFYFDGLAALKLRDAPEAERQLTLAIETDPGFALAHSAMSATWHDLGYSTRALKEAKTALDLADSAQSREDHLAVEAQYYECQFDWTRAIETYRSLWRVFPDNIEYGLKLVDVEYAAGHPSEALKVVNQLRSQPPPDGQDPRIDLYEAMGEQLSGNYKPAYDAASQAASKAEKAKARILLAQARVQQGLNAGRLNRPSEARRYYGEAIKLFEAVGDTRDAAGTLTLDAETLRELNQHDDALKEFETALQMSRKIGFTRLTNRILAAYSNILLYTVPLDKGSLEKARKACEDAIASNSGINDVGTSFTVLMDRAAIARAEGRYADARTDLAEGIRVTKQAGYRLEAANAGAVLGAIDAGLGKLKDARSELEEVVAGERVLGNRSLLAHSLGVLATVLRAEGDISGARRLSEEQCGISNRANCRIMMVRLLLDEGRSAEARDALAKLSPEFPADSLGPADLGALAMLQFDSGDVRAAKETLTIVERKLRFQAELPDRNLPLALAAAEIGKSTTGLQQVAAQAEKIGLMPLAFEARLAIAEVSPPPNRQSQLTSLALEADQKGLPLIARRAKSL